MKFLVSATAILCVALIARADNVIEIGAKGKLPVKNTEIRGLIAGFIRTDGASAPGFGVRLQNYLLMKVGKTLIPGWDWNPKTNIPSFTDQTIFVEFSPKCKFFVDGKPSASTDIPFLDFAHKYYVVVQTDRNGKAISVNWLHDPNYHPSPRAKK